MLIICVFDLQILSQVLVIFVIVDGNFVYNFNELEWVKGQFYVNVWLILCIVWIDLVSGNVVGWIDFIGFGFKFEEIVDFVNDVFNGIVWDVKGQCLFVIGKCWLKIYEIQFMGLKFLC